jgi:hypothetical protein
MKKKGKKMTPEMVAKRKKSMMTNMAGKVMGGLTSK